MELEAQFIYTDLYFSLFKFNCVWGTLPFQGEAQKQGCAGWVGTECDSHPLLTHLWVPYIFTHPYTGWQLHWDALVLMHSSAYPWELVNILALEKMTSSLPLRSVNYSDRIKSSWFPSLSSDSKVSWCSCSSGMERHSPVEVSGIILLGFFIPTWGSGVPLQAFGSTTDNCIMDNANTRMSIFGFEGKGQPASLDTFLSATRQSMPGKLLPVRLPLSFAFSKKTDFSRTVPEAAWSERLCRHLVTECVKGLNHEATWHTTLLWPTSGFCLHSSSRNSHSPSSIPGSQLTRD